MRNTNLRSAIIEDSAPQREALAHLVRKHPNLHLIGEYPTGISARPHLKKGAVDLIFLDIEMPVVSGFELLESLEHLPQTIITSAKSEYALKAFDYNVTDYLLKPIGPKRFEEAVRKALDNHVVTKVNTEDDEYIFVNSNLKKTKVQFKDIRWVEGMGDYIKVVTDSEGLMVLTTMKAFLKELPDDRFLRIHKSFIINLAKVEKFGSTSVEVDGKKLPLSRHRKQELEDALLHQD